jgi:hypothetical protein
MAIKPALPNKHALRDLDPCDVACQQFLEIARGIEPQDICIGIAEHERDPQQGKHDLDIYLDISEKGRVFCARCLVTLFVVWNGHYARWLSFLSHAHLCPLLEHS